MSKSDWERFFDGHASVYLENIFTKDTQREVDFLVEEFKLPPGSAILDVGCGSANNARPGARVKMEPHLLAIIRQALESMPKPMLAIKK